MLEEAVLYLFVPISVFISNNFCLAEKLYTTKFSLFFAPHVVFANFSCYFKCKFIVLIYYVTQELLLSCVVLIIMNERNEHDHNDANKIIVMTKKREKIDIQNT